jgi:hypothetical protein
MKTVILFFMIVILMSCIGQKGWDEKKFKEDCVFSLMNGRDAAWLDSTIGKKNIYRVCDCMVAKSVRVYKNEDEAFKDKSGFSQLLNSCIETVKAVVGK